MAMTSRQRWIVYGIAGAATLAAMWWVDRAEPEPEVVAAAAPARQPFATASAPARARTPSDDEVRLDLLKRPPPAQVAGNPFGTPVPEPSAQQQQAAAAPPPPPPKPQAPPLPFTYIGRWTEKGQTTVFLARGDTHVAVRGVGKLDETYAVESINDSQIVLTYLPLGQKQVLSLAAPVPGAPAPAPAAGGTAEARPNDNNEETN